MKRGTWRRAFEFFLVFAKIGAFTFGGGFAMIAMIEREISEKRKLLTKEEVMDIAAIAESTPGPVAINMATFVGQRFAGIPGAALATLGVVLPSFLVILLVAAVLGRFAENRYVAYAFFGIRAGVLALLVKVLIGFFRRSGKGAFPLCVMAAAFLWSAVLHWHVIALIALCGFAGVVYALVAERRHRR